MLLYGLFTTPVALGGGAVVEGSVTGEAHSNLRGGLAVGTRFLDNVDVGVSIDGDEMFGVDGLALFGDVLYDNGASIAELTGAAQGTSNIEAPRALRRYELWAEQTLGAHAVRGGFMDLNAEFDTVASASLFLTPSAAISSTLAYTGKNGPSIFPNAALGVRYRGTSDKFTGQVAVFEGTPGDPSAPERSVLRWSADEGVLGIGQLQWAGGRVQQAAIGAWGYGHDRLASRGPVGPDAGAYALLDAVLVGDLTGGPALAGWARGGVANPSVALVDEYGGAGLVLTSPFGEKVAGSFGVAVTTAHLSAGGVETILEGTARAALGRTFALQPDAQLLIHPGGDPAIPTAFTIGARVDVAWSSAP